MLIDRRDEAVMSACGRKVAYHSRKACVDAAARLLKLKGVMLATYKCKHCAMWHHTGWVKPGKGGK